MKIADVRVGDRLVYRWARLVEVLEVGIVGDGGKLDSARVRVLHRFHRGFPAPGVVIEAASRELSAPHGGADLWVTDHAERCQGVEAVERDYAEALASLEALGFDLKGTGGHVEIPLTTGNLVRLREMLTVVKSPATGGA